MVSVFPEGKPARFVSCARPVVPDIEKLAYVPLDLLIRAAWEYLSSPIEAEVRAEFAPYLGKEQVPALAYNRLFDCLHARCLADRTADEARRLIGARSLDLYKTTPINRAIYAALRFAPIEWILESRPRHYTTSQNFGTFEIGELAPRHWRLPMADFPIYPAVTLGYRGAGARVLRNDTQYAYTVIDSHTCYFDITWEVGRAA